MVTRTCIDCGGMFETEPLIFGGREVFSQQDCEVCVGKRELKSEEDARKRREVARQAAWDSLCPEEFHDTQECRLPRQFAALLTWKYQSKGVGLVGEAGRCKTRTAFLILKAAHFTGRRCFALSAPQLSKLAVDQFSDDRDRRHCAIEDLESAMHSHLLLFDDLGKGKMTERAEAELFSLLDHRTSNRLPTIWTANSSASDLLAKMSLDRGAPIIRRLVEFSEVVSA